MSEQGFKNIPGVPEGWELVAVRHAKPSDWYIGRDGEPQIWTQNCQSNLVYCIIRKIETPKKYRPFANGAEYMAENSTASAVDWSHGDASPGFFAVVSVNASFVWVAFGDKIERFDWKQAFHKLQFRHADGSTSPFGVEVKE